MNRQLSFRLFSQMLPDTCLSTSVYTLSSAFAFLSSRYLKVVEKPWLWHLYSGWLALDFPKVSPYITKFVTIRGAPGQRMLS